MNSIRAQNLYKEVHMNPERAHAIRKLKSIEIKDGKIIIRARDREKEKEGTKPADAPKSETKDFSPPPAPQEKKSGPPSGAAPADGKIPAPPESRPTTPAEPSKKP